MAREPEVLHQAHSMGQLVVVGDDCSALERIEELRGVKTEDLRVTKSTNHDVAVGTAEGMGGVEQDLEPTPAGESRDRGDIAGPAPQMHGQDPGGSRRD